jgi:RNA polymerase primary sigma factor
MSKKAKSTRDMLVNCNLRLVVSIAKQYKKYHDIPLEDLIQEGNIGLMKSIDRFKWEKGFHFSTYATWWIKQSIGQYILKHKRFIRLPAHAAAIQKKMLQVTDDYKRNNDGHEPLENEINELVKASKVIIKATMYACKNVVSLQGHCHYTTSSGDSRTDSIEDTIKDENPGSDPFQNVSEKQLLEVTKSVLDCLTYKEQAIIRLRFGLCEDFTNSSDYPITEGEFQQLKSGKGLE